MENNLLYNSCNSCKHDLPEHLLSTWVFAGIRGEEGRLLLCKRCIDHIKDIILANYLSSYDVTALYLNNQNKATNPKP